MKTTKILELLENRNGGAIAIRGFEFQFLYTCFAMLKELGENDLTAKVRLEGLEDLDIIHKKLFVQLKTSLNPIDASFLVNNNILKNFLELYQDDENSNFKLVHNSTISKGFLKKLENKKLDKKTLGHWTKKINELDDNLDINVEDFLNRISFEKTTEKELYTKSKKIILEKFNLTIGSEESFLFSLLHHILIWSKERKEVTYKDLLKVIQLVKDASSKTSTLEAINKNYISEISFNNKHTSNDLDSYFDGKSARPEHITNELPIRRKYWEEKIINSLVVSDITVIKSSSGQGKSTLAWQTAKIFEDKCFSIYELNYCNNTDQVEELYDFFKTRMKIGEIPLLIIDGLNQNVSNYGLLLERLFGFAIKIIITTREEDWNRFKIDISKHILGFINIELLEDEAKNIFIQLKQKNKLYTDIKSWQPSWEKVKEKALLIEYIFLLTHGNMIKDRLEYQVECLKNDTENNEVKIEILRLISLSDVLNIKIQTRKLTKYIQDNIGFKTYREEVYNLLEKEYFIKFDKKYIEGLHPVRSKHLLTILHNFILIEETAISLLKIIDDRFIYNYFITIPFYLDSDKEYFFEVSSEIVSQKSFTNMVDAIDGLMHFEPYNYWLNNKYIFDEVYKKGYIDVFLWDTLPFTKLDTIKTINKDIKDANFNYLIQKHKELISYDIKNSYVFIFTSCLSKKISTLIYDFDSYSNLNFLVKWLQLLNINFKQQISLNKEILLDILKNRELDESRGLFNFFFVLDKENYNNFIEENKNLIFSILKKKTDSLIIKEIDNNVNIEYLLDNEKANHLNKCSMDRIDIIYDFFPSYQRYCTKVIYLPFPNEEPYKWLVQESIKHIPNENLYHEFDVHINQIWIKTIGQHYSDNSIYEWQKNHYDLRKKLLDFTKKINRTFELFILKNKSLDKAQEVINLAIEILSVIKLRKEFPYDNIKYDDKKPFEVEIRFISNYISSSKNVLNQIFSLFDDKFSQGSNLAIINLQDVKSHLNNMQNSLKIIQSKTSNYFNYEKIEIEESYWITRLLKTVEFYRYSNEIKTSDIKNQIEKWYLERQKEELQSIYNLLNKFEQNSNYKIIYPKEVIEDCNIKEVVIGIENMIIGNFEEIIFGLVDFNTIKDLNIINIVNIIDKESTYGFRIPNTYFEKVKIYLETNEFEEDEFGNPQPLIATHELLSTLNEKITISDNNESKNTSIFIDILFDIWKLVEYREKLNINFKNEKEWLAKIEKEYSDKIKTKMNEETKESEEFIYGVLDNKVDITKEKILDLMNAIMEINLNQK